MKTASTSSTSFKAPSKEQYDRLLSTGQDLNNCKNQENTPTTPTAEAYTSHKTQIREYNKASTGFSEEILKHLEQIPQKDRKYFTPGIFVDLWF